MEWALAGSIVLSALGLIGALLRNNRETMSVALPNVTRQIIAAMERIGGEAAEREKKNRKQIKKVARRERKADSRLARRLKRLEDAVHAQGVEVPPLVKRRKKRDRGQPAA